uniref:C-C motif chemokine receptor 3 n=1 Tax=Cebus imitator TaxID=2715852 RepID=A0A2K5PZJ7_CEBIM
MPLGIRMLLIAHEPGSSRRSEMATSLDTVETFGTTPFYYELGELCRKGDITALIAKFLPPLYSLVFIVGLLGNVLVVVILIKYRRLRIMTNIYLLNLAISDLLFLFTLPFWIHYVMWSDWVFGHGMCKVISGFYFTGLYGEIFFIILLTIDRYLAIVHAVFALRARTVTFGVITSIVTWGLAVLAALPEFIFQETENVLQESYCNPVYPEDEAQSWKHFYALRINILVLALPLLVMAICYTGIIKTLLKCPNKKKYKAIRLIFVIMVVFFIFWTPYNLALLLYTFQATLFGYDCKQSKDLDLALLVTQVIAYSHCCVNPVIYAFVGERFRKYLHHFFHRHVLVYLSKYIPFLPSEKLERTSSVSPSTAEPELSIVF